MKRILAMLLAAVMVLGLAACGGNGNAGTTAAPADTTKSAEGTTAADKETEATTPAESEGGEAERQEVDTYSMIESFDISTLDYVYNNKSSNGDYTSNFIEGLLTQDTHGVLVGGMASEWSCNDDASEWTFTIRDDAVWSTNEGEVYDNVTAEDFVTGLKHAADTQSETLSLVENLIVGLADYAAGTGTWDNVGVKADGNKLTYTLTQGCGYFDGMTTYSILWPINAEFLESKGEDFGKVDASAILYNGCYILSSLVPAQEIKFDANPNYWDAENVHVQHVVVTYTNGEDPAQNFNMFTRGEVSATTINSSLPDVVAKADELYADNQYKSMTTATSYWGAFNFDRQMYTLFNDTNVSMTNKTDEEKAETKAAILNKHFRLAIYSAFSTKAYQAITQGEERALDAARNTLVPYTFAMTSDGQAYGSLVTKYLEEYEPEFKGIDLNDGQDAWYNPERAAAFAAQAKDELGETVKNWPVKLDYAVYAANENQKNRGLAIEKSIEDAIGEYVDVNLIYLEGDASVYYSAFYDINLGRENSVDFAFGAGWGPDYGDPLTYINCYNKDNGDMLHYSGLDLASEQPLESGEAAKAAIGLNELQETMNKAIAAVGDERIDLFAQCEATLLANGIIRPFSTSGASLTVSCVKPFSAAYGLYGQASYNAVPYFKYMVVYDQPVTAEEYAAAKEAWLAGE